MSRDNNAQDGEDKSKTRKKSDKNMDNYRKIVIADDSEQDENIRVITADVYKTGMYLSRWSRCMR